MEIDIESLERATLEAVVPAVVETLPGWLIPMDNSTVGRAISAVPLRHAQLDPAALQLIAHRYAACGLQARFRVADVAGLAHVQQTLRELGYTPRQPTLTLVGRVRDWPGPRPDLSLHLSSLPTQHWKSVYLSPEFDPVDGANRVLALSRSTSMVYASLCDASDGDCGGALAAGTASFSHGWASFHGLRTLERARRKGYARALIAALGREATARGFERCFLQVEENNTPAVDLYRQIGFQTAWRYHYWRQASYAVAA